MKALKTVVATAVIVFTLTTVAMAGVQHLSRRGDDTTAAGQARQATQAAKPAAQGGVTLSAHQFAALLRAVGGGSQGQAGTRSHDAAQDRTHAHRQSHAHAAGGESAGGGSSSGAAQQTALHHHETHHATTHTTSHDDGTHDGGTHDGGGDGGCD